LNRAFGFHLVSLGSLPRGAAPDTLRARCRVTWTTLQGSGFFGGWFCAVLVEVIFGFVPIPVCAAEMRLRPSITILN